MQWDRNSNHYHLPHKSDFINGKQWLHNSLFPCGDQLCMYEYVNTNTQLSYHPPTDLNSPIDLTPVLESHHLIYEGMQQYTADSDFHFFLGKSK